MHVPRPTFFKLTETTELICLLLAREFDDWCSITLCSGKQKCRNVEVSRFKFYFIFLYRLLPWHPWRLWPSFCGLRLCYYFGVIDMGGCRICKTEDRKEQMDYRPNANYNQHFGGDIFAHPLIIHLVYEECLGEKPLWNIQFSAHLLT